MLLLLLLLSSPLLYSFNDQYSTGTLEGGR